MIALLANRRFAKMFAAQVIALLGTGLLTIALGLLAYDLAGAQAGVVLGTAYTIKMVSYVALSPVANALLARFKRKHVLIGADLIRLGAALCLPFVDALWQVYGLIFILQLASASFTPAFQATLPDILPDEQDYTRALSLSRLAYDLENLLSPVLAGLLLSVMSYSGLFVGTGVGFLGSALLVLSTQLPPPPPAPQRSFVDRLTRGMRIYLATPRLRGLLAFNLSVAATGAFVLVNTVVIVRDTFGLEDTGLAIAMGAYGAGSMIAAFALPALLERFEDRRLMGFSALALGLSTLAIGLYWSLIGPLEWRALLVVWGLLGVLNAAVLTPSGRLLRRSAHSEDRPAIFAAQFALSHVCWLICYPLAGWSGVAMGLGGAMVILGCIGLAASLLGLKIWPAGSGAPIVHAHPDLPADHPHLKSGNGARRHAHVVIIDDQHRVWPTQG